MAHIRKLDSGRWQARYRNPEDRREIARNFTAKRDAQRWLDDVTASLVRRDYADPKAGALTVGALATVWLEGNAPLKPSTRQSYRGLLETHVLPRWGGVELRKVTTSAVGAWVGQLSAARSASTTRKALGVLRAILDLAVADRRLAVNPASGVIQPRLPLQEMRFLSAVELERLAAAIGSERDRMLVLVLGWTGLRFGEAAALRREDADILRRRLRIGRAVAEVNGVIHVGTTKTHQARTVAFAPFLADCARLLPANTAFRRPALPERRGQVLERDQLEAPRLRRGGGSGQAHSPVARSSRSETHRCEPDDRFGGVREGRAAAARASQRDTDAGPLRPPMARRARCARRRARTAPERRSGGFFADC